MHTPNGPVPGLRDVTFDKGSARGTVRMETPVIYFYTPRVRDVSVAVTFPTGRVTEWYPQAEEIGQGGVDWGTVRLFPPGHPDAPALQEATDDGHYWSARVDDSAVVRVCGARADEAESLLFYRGVGSFPLSLKVRLAGDQLQLSGPPGQAIVFERDGDRVGVDVVALGAAVEVPRPTLADDLGDAREATRAILSATGLYPAEVEAMLATWDDDWFEPGLRVFTVLPRAETDALLPLTVSPAPDELVRTLVGRVEVVTPEVAARAVALLQAEPDPVAGGAAVAKAFPRFAEPILASVAAGSGPAHDRAAAALAALAPAP